VLSSAIYQISTNESQKKRAKKMGKIIGVEKPPLAVPSYLQEYVHSTVPPAIKQLEEIDPDSIQCLEFRVLLKVLGAESVTKGGIYRSAQDIEKELFSKCSADVVNFGEEAFCLSDGTPMANRPKPGDRVMIAKYAGITVRDKDYNLYRFANDKDVVAITKGEKA